MRTLERLEAEIRDGLYGKITSLGLSCHGECIYEWHIDDDADAMHNTRSATKTVAGLLVGIGIDRGELAGVDTPLVSFFDDLAPFAHDGPIKRAVTLHDVLTMSSALDCDDSDPDSPGNEEVMYEAPDWLRFALDIPTRPAADGAWHYCTAGVTALAGVLERATGRPLDAYASEHLFEPLGIVGERWFRSPTGLVQTGGGLELRTRDLLALGQLALDGGRANGRSVVSSAWVRTSMSAHRRIDEQTAYGYLWWLRMLPLGGGTTWSPMMQGNGGNKVAVLPELDAVAVVTSTNFGTPGMHAWTDTILVDYLLPAVRARSGGG